MQRVAHPGSDGFHNVATFFTASTTGVDNDTCAPFTPPTSPPPLAYTGMPMAAEPGIAVALLLLGAGASDAAEPASSNQQPTTNLSGIQVFRSDCLVSRTFGSCSGRNTGWNEGVDGQVLQAHISENVQVFWAALQRGEFVTDAAEVAGTHRKQGTRWVLANGGVRPRRGRNLKGRCLSFAEREEVALGRAGGESMRSIAARLGRSPSTISRELGRNAEACGRYRASSAHAAAWERASRPKPAKLAANLVLREKVERDLEKRYSPEQIAGRLRVEFPDDPEMWVSHETIYQSLYVQSRGALRRELTACLRTGRALRHPSRHPGQRKNRIPDMVNISERPAEAADRAVPGHWEGDLIIGRRNLSAIGTLVERSSGYTMLVHLPDGYKPEQVAPALTAKIQTLPEAVRRSLTWDQGPEMRDWKQVKLAADIEIFFCDPHSPWQRGTNENTNGLLRQYFPKGSDLSVHSQADLDWVAAELNDRPLKRLGFRKPDEQISELILG